MNERITTLALPRLGAAVSLMMPRFHENVDEPACLKTKLFDCN
jgi:hypothetical protein